jgi:AcrR family transcriptional regulator
VSSYHHGNLRESLIETGIELARTQGPDGVVLREVARRTGVSHNAAYRHFADREALLKAVAAAIQDRVAARMRGAPRRHGSPALQARDRLRAVGLGYIKFALDEPGWFTVAFFGAGLPAVADEQFGASRAPPYRALVEALDDMVDTGMLTTRQRKNAEWPCWSTAHGFAELCLHGPLRNASRREVESLARRAIDDIVGGLSR